MGEPTQVIYWDGKPSATVMTMMTEKGLYTAGYWPGADQGEVTRVFGPNGEKVAEAHTPGFMDGQLHVNNGELVVRYSRWLGEGQAAHPVMDVRTGVMVGGPAATTASETVLAGPQGPIGSAGAVGPRGAQGPTGPQGPIGPQGPRGIDGYLDPRIGQYADGATIRGQLDAIENWQKGALYDGEKYIVERVQALEVLIKTLQSQIIDLTKLVTDLTATSGE